MRQSGRRRCSSIFARPTSENQTRTLPTAAISLLDFAVAEKPRPLRGPATLTEDVTSASKPATAPDSVVGRPLPRSQPPGWLPKLILRIFTILISMTARHPSAFALATLPPPPNPVPDSRIATATTPSRISDLRAHLTFSLRRPRRPPLLARSSEVTIEWIAAEFTKARAEADPPESSAHRIPRRPQQSISPS